MPEKETTLEISVTELAKRVKKLLSERSVEEVTIPCSCIPMVNRVREYIDAEVGSLHNMHFVYQTKLVTDKVQLESAPQQSNDTYYLVVRRGI